VEDVAVVIPTLNEAEGVGRVRSLEEGVEKICGGWGLCWRGRGFRL